MKQPSIRRLRYPESLVLLSVVIVSCVAAGCYPKKGAAPTHVSTDTQSTAATKWPGVTPESLAKGHDLFIAKCNGCHDYPDLVAIDEDEWPSIVKRMGGKSDLNASDTDDVLHFVLAARSEKAK